MIHYNNDNNAYCSAVNAQKFETREHNTVEISTFVCTRNLYSYSYLEIFICIYSVRGEIDHIYPQIHLDIQPAAQQMFTCLFTC